MTTVTDLFRQFAAVGVLAAAATAAGGVDAATVLVFGQNGTADTIAGTANGGQTQTIITGTDIPVTLTAIENGAPGTQAFFDFTATSTGATFTCLGADTCQLFSGTFSFNSAANNTGTNYLSGTFTDAIFGSGNGLTLSAGTPGETVTFVSDVITSLGLERAISLSFTNVLPPVSVCGITLCSFASNVSGNFSGEISKVPTLEVPTLSSALMAVLALLLAVTAWRVRRR